MLPSIIAAVFTFGVATALNKAQLREKCTLSGLKEVVPEAVTVLSAEYVPDGGSYGQGALDLSYPFNGTALPEICAAILAIYSSGTSSQTMGIYLPLDWDFRFMQVGNGAFAGGINWLDMATASRYKMATVSTDTGHNSTQTDSSWALGDKEAQANWGWRAIHDSLVIGRQITEGFYASHIKHTYYMGASTGGRQGLREIQSFPESYDAVIVGAPGWWTNHLQPWMTRVFPQGSISPISIPQQNALAAEVVRQCDGIDGVEDGIISYPEQCRLDYSQLLCGSQSSLNSTVCFSEGQIETLKRTYGDYHTENGDFVFPGLMISSEAEWYALLGGDTPTPLGYGWVRDMLLGDSSWRWQDYNDTIVHIADQVNPGSANAGSFDLSAFRDAGGKIVMYQGLSDGGFSARSAQIYYENVAEKLGYKDCGQELSPSSSQEMQSWFKFFYVPGMHHCVSSSVDAPWYINGPNQAVLLGLDVYSVPGYEDSQHDIIAATIDWVEQDRDFASIIGTAYRNQKPSDGVIRQRPLCPYPEKQVYTGSGDADNAESWECIYDGPSI